MNVIARSSVSVIVGLSVNMNVTLDRERQHERETQRAKFGLVWSVNQKNNSFKQIENNN